MAKIPFVFLLCVVIVTCINHSSAKEEDNCVQRSPCSCAYNNGYYLDLSPLAAQKTFLEDTAGQLTYFFHPCSDIGFDPAAHNITIGKDFLNGCTQPLSVCLYNRTGDGSLTNLGSANQSKFSNVASNSETQKLIITPNNSTNVTIILACSSYETSALKIMQNNGTHRLIFFSPYACAKEEHTISSGTVLLIIFFCFTMSYLIIGMAVMRFIRGARGIEMIPNLQFWREIPLLVRDGTMFLLNGCNPPPSTAGEAYDRI